MRGWVQMKKIIPVGTPITLCTVERGAPGKYIRTHSTREYVVDKASPNQDFIPGDMVNLVIHFDEPLPLYEGTPVKWFAVSSRYIKGR